MEFKLPRQILPKEIKKIISRELQRQQLTIPSAPKKTVKELADIFKIIETQAMPPHLICKKLPHDLGHGIFLRPNAKPILRGSVIAFYAGEVSIVPQNNYEDIGDYAFAPLSDMKLTKEEQQLYHKNSKFHPNRLYSLKLDALDKGNFTRFINHSDKPNVVAELLAITSNNRLGLASSPIEVVYLAKKKILPGEQLLTCYDGEDQSYWGGSDITPFQMDPKTFRLNASCALV